MKIEKDKHAPGSVLLLEFQGQIHEAVIVGWSPMGQAVKIMAGQTQMWLPTPKAHAIEFLRIIGWDEFKRMMEDAEIAKSAKEPITEPKETENAESGSEHERQ